MKRIAAIVAALGLLASGCAHTLTPAEEESMRRCEETGGTFRVNVFGGHACTHDVYVNANVNHHSY
jgi:hypothetical protein